MSEYLLYGNKMIENDNTMKDFASCVYNSCPMEAIMDDGEERKDFILETVEQILIDDIVRTDINYEKLLYKYRMEIGGLLYEMDNRGMEIPKIVFFSDEAKKFFNELIYSYIEVHYEEFEQGK